MAIARGACFDPSEFIRGPMIEGCAEEFVLPCVETFTATGRNNPDCSRFTDTTDQMDCLALFNSYRDSICAR
jgi:hypothetical protein